LDHGKKMKKKQKKERAGCGLERLIVERMGE
jgi:hypothetical protein